MPEKVKPFCCYGIGYGRDGNALIFLCKTEEEEAPQKGDIYYENEWDGYEIRDIFTDFCDIIFDSATEIPWQTYNSNVDTVVFDESFAKARPIDLAWWFYGCYYLTSVIGIEYLNTSEATSMEEMFWNCQQLETLDVSNWDTGKVTNMHDTFSGMESISKLDVSNWDVSSVTTMYGMFYNCQKLTEIPVNNWQIDNLTSMHGVFDYCTGLKTVNLNNWDTSLVTDMENLFRHCESLIELDVSNFNTANVTSMYGMFQYCYLLIELDVSNFNTANVTNMYGMFNTCNSLVTIYSNDSNFVTTNVTDSEYMFTGCNNLVGGNGTSCPSSTSNLSVWNASRAHIDTASNPGYFTDINDRS